MSERPLAFHITFGTYGTRLHGDARGTIDRQRNTPGDPIIGRDEDWERFERSRLRFPPIVFTAEQRRLIEQMMPAVCETGGWEHHIAAAGPDHVHVLLTAQPEQECDAIRRLLKRWLGQELSRRWALPDGATWWAEGGSVKWVCTQRYYETCWEYIAQQRTLKIEDPRAK